MSFRIIGLPLSKFAPLFELSDQELLERNAVRRMVEKQPGSPCRVSLRDAAIGESVILLNHEHLSVVSPYRSSHAIFVRETAQEAVLEVNEIPDMVGTRLLSIRAFDSIGMMRTADVVQGSNASALIDQMLLEPAVEYLHIHYAKAGCYAARVERTAGA